MNILKNLLKTGVCFAALMMCSIAQAESPILKVAMVNFKNCVEASKLGKKEQTAFESLKKQMEAVLEEKEKTLNEIATKFNDADYMDSLSPDAENELKHKFRVMNQELSQHQNQYYQALNQANYKIIQQLTSIVAKAAEKVAKDNGFDLVLNEEGTFYYASALDISDKVVKAMDDMYETELKNQKIEPVPTIPGTPQAVAPVAPATNVEVGVIAKEPVTEKEAA